MSEAAAFQARHHRRPDGRFPRQVGMADAPGIVVDPHDLRHRPQNLYPGSIRALYFSSNRDVSAGRRRAPP